MQGSDHSPTKRKASALARVAAASLALAFMHPCPVSAQSAPAHPSAAQPERRYTVVAPDGVRIAVRERGAAGAPAIILIHGFTLNSLAWRHQLSGRLPDRFRVIAYDTRGHGASDKPLDAPSYTEGRRWGDELKAVMDAAGARRPVLVGWSMGGVVIANYVKAYGDGGIAGIVFVSAVIKRLPQFGRQLSRDNNLALASDDLAVRTAAIRTFTDSMFAGTPRQDDRDTMLAATAMVPPFVVRNVMKGISLEDTEAALHTLKVPILVMRGSRDKLVRSDELGRWQAAFLPNAQLSLFPNAGHALFMDAPDRFDRELAAFAIRAFGTGNNRTAATDRGEQR